MKLFDLLSPTKLVQYTTPLEWAQAQVRDPSGYYISGAEGGGLIDAATGQSVTWNPETSSGPAQSTGEGGGYAYDPGQTLRQVLYGNADYPIVDVRLQQIASAAGLYNFDWQPYQALVAQAGTLKNWNGFYNYMIPVLTWAMAAAKDYPELYKVIPQFAEGTEAWIEGERVAQETQDRSKREGQIEMAVMVVVGSVFGAAAFAAAGAGSAVVVESGVATVQGAELAALVESGTVGAEGAFLEAAALSGSSVTFSTTTGAIMSAVTPAGETVVFDAAIDPFTQFGEMPIDTVKMPGQSLQAPNQTPQGNAAPQAQPVTEYAKKLIAGEAMKLLTGGQQAPGATAIAQKNAAPQELALEQEMGDITPLVALAMVAGAFVLRNGRKRP